MSKPNTRRRWIKTVLGLGIVVPAGAVAYARFFESSWLRVNRITLPPKSFPVEKPLRILHLSDFHASDVVSYELIEEAVDLGLAESPDIAFLTGDFITWELENEERYLKILTKLRSAVSCFACLGNHDGGKWAGSSKGYATTEAVEKLLQDADIALLPNRTLSPIFVKGQPLTITGLGDLWAEELHPEKCLRPKRESNPTGDPPVILLCHNPDAKDKLSPYLWDLMLSGHTHGGQCRLPWFGTPFAPVRDHAYVEGLHEWQGRLIHITRGVGNLHGFRFNCRPEVSILEASPA